MKQTMSRFFKMLPWLVLALSLAFSLFLYARYGENTLDSDQSSDFVQASHLNQKGALLSKEWFYSTELNTVSPIPIYQLGLLLFRSWHHARIFSIMIIAAATIASFLSAARAPVSRPAFSGDSSAEAPGGKTLGLTDSY